MFMGQLAFYQPQTLLPKKKYDLAIFMISIAAEILPADPGLRVEMAAVSALKGKPDHKKALDFLREAVDKGLADRKALERPEFEELRKEPKFQEIVARMP